MGSKLHNLDLELHAREHIEEGDKCFYFMEKEAEGYAKSTANNLINNFKKPADRRGKPEWIYKERAIKIFIKDLCDLGYSHPYTIIPAPTSKPRGHADWDDRLDQVVDGLASCKTELAVEKALDTNSVLTPAHLGGSRDIDDIKDATVWRGIGTLHGDTVILVDDVLTTGAHFKAWKEFIMKNDSRVKNVIGLFWTLHIWGLPFKIED